MLNYHQDIKLKVAFVGPLLLHHAVSCGDTNAVRKLVKRQNTILAELSPEEANSLLRVAASSDNSFNMAKLLVELGLGSQHTGTNVGDSEDGLDRSVDANKVQVSSLQWLSHQMVRDRII